MTLDIITLGEPLIEFSAVHEGNLCKGNMFLQGFGGDTSNFAVSAARSGGKVGYITAIGKDPFGNALLNLWRNENIDVTTVKEASQHKTGIYFISRNNGNHLFTYFRKNSAASNMTPDIIDPQTIEKAKILHFTGITQGISISACDTSFRAISIAKKSKTLVSYDPNLRTDLWQLDRARAIIHNTIPKTDIVFPSYEDACLLSGLSEPEKISDYYLNMGPKIVVLKLGEKGALLAYGQKRKFFAPFPVKPVDSSGAGDTFCGAFITEYVNGNSLDACMRFAGTAAALSTTGIGCVSAIPKRDKTISTMEKI